MSITYLNKDERAALQGLSLEAKTLYVFELRTYADENGTTGLKRRHSFQSFKEQLTVLPDWGSKSKIAVVSVGKIRAVLLELERHNLIKKTTLPLVFILPLAMQDKSVQKRNDTENTKGTTQGTTQENLTAPTVTWIGTTQGTTQENQEERHTSPCIKKEKGDFERLLSETPKNGTFAMHFDFKPTKDFFDVCRFAGLEVSKFDEQILKDFIVENRSSESYKTQKQWEAWLKNFFAGALVKKTKPTNINYQPKHKQADEPRMNIPEFVPEPPKPKAAPVKRTTSLSSLFE